MLKEALVEKKIVEALDSALEAFPDVPICGLWQPTAAGMLKGLEEVGAPAFVEIATGQISQTAFSSAQITCEVSVTLQVRLEMDGRGEHMIEYVEPIRDLFQEWMSSTYQRSFTALDVAGVSIDDLSVDGGKPQIDVQAKVARVPWTLTLSGSYQDTNE